MSEEVIDHEARSDIKLIGQKFDSLDERFREHLDREEIIAGTHRAIAYLLEGFEEIPLVRVRVYE